MLVSAVLAVDRYETASETVEALLRQTIAGELEVVFAGPGLVVPDEQPDGLAGIRLVETPIEPLSVARARAVLACTGRFVFVAETHALPRPDCLELLVEELERGAGAVMPRIANANPDSARSWASLFATYGAFTGPSPISLNGVALHNGCFRRDLLAAAAVSPPELVYGVGLSERLREADVAMRYVPGAVIDHLNVTSPRVIVKDRLFAGRLWAASRSASWSSSRRLAHAAAFPLAPFVMTGRIVRSEGWRRRGTEPPRGTLPLIAAMAGIQAAGEAIGYTCGQGRAESSLGPLELHRRASIS